jgi:hypothetical protein
MNFKDLAEELAKHVGAAHDVLALGRSDGVLFTPAELEKFVVLVAVQVRARCIELVLAGSSMPVQTRTLEALQRDRRRIAKLIEEDGKP